jgi:hypothetical protein
LFNLGEAKQELEVIINQIKNQETPVDKEAIRQRYSQIFWHLATAWNTTDMRLDAVNSLDDDEFVKIGHRLPWLGPEFFIQSH